MLRLQRRPEAALKIYELGRKRAKAKAEIERQVTATKAQMKEAQARVESWVVDIFQVLPGELIRRILRHLPWPDRIQVLNMSEGSRRYRHHSRDWRYRLILQGEGSKYSLLVKTLLRGNVPERKVREIICFPHQQSWDTAVKLAEKGYLKEVQTMRLFDLSITWEVFLSMLAKMPRLLAIYCKRCLFTPISEAPRRNIGLSEGSTGYRTVYFSQCRAVGELEAHVGRFYDRIAVEGSSLRTFVADFVPPKGCPFYARAGRVVEMEWDRIRVCRWPNRGSLVEWDETDKTQSPRGITGVLSTRIRCEWSQLEPFLSSRCSLHCLHITCLQADLQLFVEKIAQQPLLREIGLHVIESARGSQVVEPQRLIDGLLTACPHLRLLCLPFLSVLSLDRQRALAVRMPPTCRLVLDLHTSVRLACRFCRITRWMGL